MSRPSSPSDLGARMKGELEAMDREQGELDAQMAELAGEAPSQSNSEGKAPQPFSPGKAEYSGDRVAEDAAAAGGPTDGQLHEAIHSLRQVNPSLGVPKLLAKLKESNPAWQLSEKRLRKYLSAHPTLSASSASQRGAPCDPLWVQDYEWLKEYEEGQGEGFMEKTRSSLDDGLLLECQAETCKVEPVRFEEAGKGSGLVAKTKIVKGAQIFKEGAYVWVPSSKTLSRHILSGHACAYCGRIFAASRLKTQVPCPHHPPPGSKKAKAAQSVSKSTTTTTNGGGEVITEKPDGPEPCYQKFCNRVCATKSATELGPLVCPQKNPEYIQVFRHADQEDVRAPHLVFKLWARMLMANEEGEPISESPRPGQAMANLEVENDETKPAEEKVDGAEGGELSNGSAAGTKKSKKAKAKKKAGVSYGNQEYQAISTEMERTMRRIEGLATLNDRARREQAAGTQSIPLQMIEYRLGNMWRVSWHLVVRALHIQTGQRPKPDKDSATDEFWAEFWKRRLHPKTIARLFGIIPYLEMLGKVNLNQEHDGGLYLLHARINHSCDPNTALVRNVAGEDRSKISPSTIYLVAKRDIEVEDEITITYVPPDAPLEHRRKKLHEEYGFSCFCRRCRAELQEAADRSTDEDGATIKELGDGYEKPGLKEDLLAHFA